MVSQAILGGPFSTGRSSELADTLGAFSLFSLSFLVFLSFEAFC